jgi:RHS repeat-associated protein
VRGALGPVNAIRFSSMIWYDRPGVIGYPFRFYDPGLERWVQPDPVEEAGGMNLHSFVLNSPLNAVDPLGFEVGYTYDAKGMHSGLDSPEAAARQEFLWNKVLVPTANGAFWLMDKADQAIQFLKSNEGLPIRAVGGALEGASWVGGIPETRVMREARRLKRLEGALRLLDESKPVGKACSAVAKKASQTLREMLTATEQAEFEALRAKYPGWMPQGGLDAEATFRTVAENAEARAEFTGRGHHPHPLKFGGEPNPPDLMPTGETPTQKNPIHTEITSFWNRVMRRLNSEAGR